MRHRLTTVLLCVLLGWAFFGPSALGADGRKAVLTGDWSDLRERPDINSETIVAPGAGEAVLIILCLEDSDTVGGVTGLWCLVRYRGVEGWVFDAALNTADPRAETSYRDVPSFSEKIERLDQLRSSGDLAQTERECAVIIEGIESNFSRRQIRASGRISGALLGAFSDRIETLVYLHRFDEARAAYAYLVKTYPDIRLEDDSTTAHDQLEPYMVFMDYYESAPLFTNPGEPMKKLRAALEQRDLSAVSNLAVPGIFEVWVAHTDWVIRLGDQALDRQVWMTGSWATSWKITGVSTRIDEAGNLVGYCIETEPWSLNYFEIQVNRVDFCVDRLPDGTFAFSYMTLYTRPIR